MLYTFPDYYKEFSCIADKCEDTCCAGWEIVIDKKSLNKYKMALRTDDKSMRRRLLTSVKWVQGTFRQGKDKRCAFLNDHNLCDLYSGLGEKSLCKTCRLYPRHIEEFEDVREVTLSISCPEVARILMNKKDPVHFLEYEKPGEEEYEEYDPFLYSVLADTRDVLIEIAQNREVSMDVRVRMIHGLAHDIQTRIDRSQLFSCEEVLERYQNERAILHFEKICKRDISDKHIHRRNYEKTKHLYEKLYTLELLRDDWESLVYETEAMLYEQSWEDYDQLEKEFANWLKEEMPDWEIQCEQILVYFLSTYFCGAVYDGEAYEKVMLALISVCLIRELLLARWLKNEKTLTTEDVIEIVYRYSREIEHSDPNLEEVESWGKA